MKRWCAILLVVAFPALARDFEVAQSTATFDSGDKQITVETFSPKDPEHTKFPTILLIHGADGLALRGFFYDPYAKYFASKGYVVILPHYFQRTDTKVGDFASNMKHFAAWMSTIQDAITWAEKQPYVDDKRIGLLGVSLGSYLSVTLAGKEPRVKAVVEYFGGISPLAIPGLKKAPPILILHGEADKIVPISEAHRLEQVLKDKEITYDIHTYPGQGHGFIGPDADDSRKRALEWFGKYLVTEEKPKD